MSESNDVLFRIGFVPHPDAQSRMEAFARGVESAQARVGQAAQKASATESKAIRSFAAVESTTAKSRDRLFEARLRNLDAVRSSSAKSVAAFKAG